MCPRPLGRAAAGVGLLEKQEPGARQHPERQAGSTQHDQLLLWPAHRLPHLRVPTDHLLLQLAPPARTHPGGAHQHREHPQLCGQHLAQVGREISFLRVVLHVSDLSPQSSQVHLTLVISYYLCFSLRLRKGCGAGCNSGGNIEDPDAGGLSSGSGNGTGGDSQQSSVSQGGMSGPVPPYSYQPHPLGKSHSYRIIR